MIGSSEGEVIVPLEGVRPATYAGLASRSVNAFSGLCGPTVCRVRGKGCLKQRAFKWTGFAINTA